MRASMSGMRENIMGGPQPGADLPRGPGPAGALPMLVDMGLVHGVSQPGTAAIPPKDAPPPAAGAILAPTANLKAFKEIKPLPDDEIDEDASDRLDVKKWFEDFESACWRGYGAGVLLQHWWLDQLLLRATPHARHYINSILTTLSHERPQLDRFQQYIEVRDSLLLEQPDRYSAATYFDQLTTLRPGERRALALQRHVRRLWNHYEAARRREAKATPPKDMPYLTEYFVANGVQPPPQACDKGGCTPLSVFVSEGPEQLFLRYAQRAAAFEAANPSPGSYVVAGAVSNTGGSLPPCAERKAKLPRGLQEKALPVRQAKRAATET